MRELTQKEYFDLFGYTSDKGIRMAVSMWNASRPGEYVEIIARRLTGAPQIYRECLPASLEAALAANEAKGVVYVEGFFS